MIPENVKITEENRVLMCYYLCNGFVTDHVI